MLADAALPCPCGTGRPYGKCCGMWHAGPRHLQAPDAQALMRSRYSAYVLDLVEYVRDTWHPDTRPPHIDPNPPGLKWLGLEVKRHVVQDDTHALVEFVARSRLQGKGQRMHETSRFVKENGRWFYVDGVVD
ncbi:YchJ family protein [Bordetella bronchialis]|uniref:UPF0225 protein BAU06_18390 n=1 Tax=Bordetella bronchialis TaxID=463025 RepID=A0A193FZA3_9BORD|nr:YchJ family protein [Bordetella bronchialis]ANN68002.1 hypothetical protein BAU06_18390 [Bordetella bronchialis]ANN73092.1 hypothetical protein BAU08_18615 [Bordetella bronchialis]